MQGKKFLYFSYSRFTFHDLFLPNQRDPSSIHFYAVVIGLFTCFVSLFLCVHVVGNKIPVIENLGATEVSFIFRGLNDLLDVDGFCFNYFPKMYLLSISYMV